MLKRAKVLALILAGGEGSRLKVLTERRAKPALPYAGVYRLIDFPLSNCVHSGLSDIWVVEQFQPHALNDHLVNGRPWDLDRTYGGLRIMPPYTGTRESGWAEGNADAIYRHQRFIREFRPDVILVLSSDHVYKLDYRDVLDEHFARRADVTMVTTEVPLEEAGRYGTVEVDGEGRVTGFAYKPESPASRIITTEVFIYDADKLLDTLDALVARKKGGEADAGETGLKDFGHELLPSMVDEGRAYAYPLKGYWRDVGVIESYHLAHMDLLEDAPPLNLDESSWPILTFGNQRMPAHVAASARIENSLISPGCAIRGHVSRSVLAPGVVVEEGAVVRDSVVLHDTIVGAHARVTRAILDSGVIVGREAVIGHPGGEKGGTERVDSSQSEITIVGQGLRIPDQAEVPPGDCVGGAFNKLPSSDHLPARP